MKNIGERIFDQQGEPAAYMNAVCEQLMTLMHGNQRTSAFITTLLEHELLEAVQLSLTQHGEKQTCIVAYTPLTNKHWHSLTYARLSHYTKWAISKPVI
ncbi:SapC family protein [Pseudoalteromonas sp. B193]